jgi:hypothetical protein
VTPSVAGLTPVPPAGMKPAPQAAPTSYAWFSIPRSPVVGVIAHGQARARAPSSATRLVPVASPVTTMVGRTGWLATW